MLIRSPAKINLYLEVLHRESDGFHRIRTIFQTVGLYDELLLTPLKRSIFRVICSNPKVPLGNENLIIKALNALRDIVPFNQGLEVRLKKNIPLGAGLGGGSSNVASVLKGVNRLYRLGVKRTQLIKIAGSVSSDAPFFMSGGTALGRGRGDEITPLSHLKGIWVLLIFPPIQINTGRAYSLFEKYGFPKRSFRLTNIENISKIGLLLRREKWSSILYNSFEFPIFKEYPILARLERYIRSEGFKNTLLSGSGSTIFVILRDREEGRDLERRLRKFDCQTRLIRTI